MVGGDGERLRAAVRGKQLLQVVTGAQDGLVVIRSERHQIGGPILPVQVDEARCVRRHLHHVRVPLRAQQVHPFADGGHQGRVEDVLAQRHRVVDHAVGRVDLENRVLAHEHGHVGVAGRLLPVVEKVKVFDEVARLFVVVSVPHASGWDLVGKTHKSVRLHR